MIIVTGGAGFIGSNLVRALNARGEAEIVVVDELTDGHKFANMVDCDIADYWDKSELARRIETDSLGFKPKAILHQGACAVTTQWDGAYMMETNYSYSKLVLNYCLVKAVPLIYASSAAVYGSGPNFKEVPDAEHPLNVYGYSKSLFDCYVRRLESQHSQVVGLRYFNVYGPNEAHKGSMASVVWHLRNQLLADDEVRLFEGSDGYAAGEQRRDFVYVGDVVDVNLWFLEHPQHSGVFNVGTGRSHSFNELAAAVLAWHGRGVTKYIPFPAHLQGSYQSFTEADITALREIGYDRTFRDITQGVEAYLDALAEQPT